MQMENAGMLKVAGIKLFDVNEVAKQLGIAAKTVKKLIREGQLPGRKLGKSLYVVETKLKEFIERGDEDLQERKGTVPEPVDPDAILGVGESLDEEGNEPFVRWPVIEYPDDDGEKYIPGTILQMITDRFIVAPNGKLVPLDPTTAEPVPFYPGHADIVEEALSISASTDDDDDAPEAGDSFEEDSDEEPSDDEDNPGFDG